MLLRGAKLLAASLRRLDRVWVDRVVALLLVVVAEMEAWLSYGAGNRLATAVGGAIVSGAVAIRRRWPFAALLTGVGAVIAQDALDGSLTRTGFAAVIPGLLLFYGAGAFLSESRARRALSVGLALISVDAFIPTVMLENLFWVNVLFAALPWSAGRMSRERAAREHAFREHAERLDSARETHVRTAARGERARLAQEIHDVIGHSVSVMVIQAAGALAVMDAEPDRAEAALRSVGRAGRDAMIEMRRLLGMLGDGGAQTALTPQPGIGDLEQLVNRTRATGLTTTFCVEGPPAAISPAVGLCAYRIVQEALTNTIKHAGAARAEVRVRWIANAVELEIRDDGRGPINAGAGQVGYGIPGMRERVALHGGSIETAGGVSGGFAVRARIPLAAEDTR